MANWKKIAIGTGIGGALVAAGTWLFRLKQASVKMEVVPTIKIHKLDLTGLYIRVDVQLKNPTQSSFKIKYPFVKLAYKGVTVGSSQMVNRDIVLPSFGEAQISEIMIRIPVLSVFTTAGKLFAAIKNNEEVKVDVITLSTIDIGIKKIPFTYTESLSLKK